MFLSGHIRDASGKLPNAAGLAARAPQNQNAFLVLFLFEEREILAVAFFLQLLHWHEA